MKSEIDPVCEFHSQARYRVRRGPAARRPNAAKYDYPAHRHAEQDMREFEDRAPIHRTVQQELVRLNVLREKLRSLKPTVAPALREGLERTIAELEAKLAAA